jgi:hypothetical protein
MKSGDFDANAGTMIASCIHDAAANDIISFSFVLKPGSEAARERARLTATLITPVCVEEENPDCETFIALHIL